MSERPDIYTTRPPGETVSYSIAMIKAELKEAGVDVDNARFVQGSTQPDGSVFWYIFF